MNSENMNISLACLCNLNFISMMQPNRWSLL